jgi:branched-chain amino acid transport system substrate-binding protein
MRYAAMIPSSATILRTLSVAALAALIVTPTAGRSADTTPLEIYTFVSITGPAAFVGSRTATAIAAIETYVNKQGGVRGRPVKLVVQDDQTNPAVAVQIMNQYLTKKPAIIVGGMFAASCLASAALIKDNGPVMYCFSPAVHPAPGSWVYSGSFITTDLYASAIRYFRMKGYTKIGLLTTTDATGQDADNTIPDVMARPENRGLTLTAREHFGVTEISTSAQLERIRASGAQAMIVWASGTPFGTVLRGLRDGGIDMPVYTSQANLIYSQLLGYKSIWPTTTPILMGGIPPITPDAIPDRRVRQSIDRYLTAMKAAGIEHPDVAEAIVWDLIQIIVEGYRRVGPDATPAQMRDYLNGIRDWPGIYGKLDYKASPQRGVQGDWVNIIRWDPETAKFTAVSKPGGTPL